MKVAEANAGGQVWENLPRWYSDKVALTSGAFSSDQQRMEAEEARIGDAVLKSTRTSIANNTATSIIMVNRLDEKVSYYWEDLEGGEQFYGSIEPGERKEQETFISHQWKVRKESDSCLVCICEGKAWPRVYMITKDYLWRTKDPKNAPAKTASDEKTLYCDRPNRTVAGVQQTFNGTFNDKDYSTMGPYKFFLNKGGFSAFPNALIFRLDYQDLRDVDPVTGTYSATIKISMNTVETRYSKGFSHKYKFSAQMVNCLAGAGTNILMENQVQGFDGNALATREPGFDKQWYLYKAITDEAKGADQKKWVYDESFSVTTLSNVTFSENMELEEFPFDVQKVKILIAVWNIQDKIVIPVGGETSFKSPLPEWDLIGADLDFQQHDQMTSPQIDGPANICYSLTLKRKYDWFVFNNISLMFLISSLQFLVLGIKVTALSSRAGVTLTILLTVVAQKFSLVSSIPKLGYLTLMDKYILMLFSFTIGLTAEALCMERLHKSAACPKNPKLNKEQQAKVKCEEQATVEALDMEVLYGILVAYVLANVYFAVRVRFRISAINKMGSNWEQNLKGVPKQWVDHDAAAPKRKKA